VTRDEVAALPGEYRHEPELGLLAGEDGLDLVLRILRDAPSHLVQGGVLIVEVGESEHALQRLLPDVPFEWIEFKVGAMGVFAIHREALVAHAAQIRALADARAP
jgi:ribosomal protein L3 glutamine methyltransferase